MTRQYELMVIMTATYDFSKESAVKEMLQTLVGDTLSVKDLTIYGKKNSPTRSRNKKKVSI